MSLLTLEFENTLLNLLSTARPFESEPELELIRELDRLGWQVELDSSGYPICAWLNPCNSNTWLTAHSDTVSRHADKQKVKVKAGIAMLSKPAPGSVLGADCSTGVALLHHLSLVRSDVGYIIFTGEECGCIGSRAVAATNHPINSARAIISLDRAGTSDVITHQVGRRTCAANYAAWLASELGMKPSPNGVFTDSNEFTDTCKACTNISVGYRGQHGPGETQDIEFAKRLLTLLARLDFNTAPEPEIVDELTELADFIKNNSRQVAEVILEYGLYIEDFKVSRRGLRYEPLWEIEDDEPVDELDEIEAEISEVAYLGHNNPKPLVVWAWGKPHAEPVKWTRKGNK